MLSTSILTADTLQNKSMDNWNHPKIPRLKELEQPRSNNEKVDSWTDIDSQGDILYTSLTGVSVLGLQPDSVATFSVPYEYMYMDCALHMRAHGNDTLAFFYPMLNTLFPSGWPRNSSEGDAYNSLFNVSFLTANDYTYYESSFFLVSAHNYSIRNVPNSSIYYGTKDGGRDISVYQCSMDSLMVEARMTCNSAACHVHQMRRSLEPRDVPGKSDGRPWDVVNQEYASRYFFQYFPSMGGMISRFSWHPIDNYIYGASSKPCT
jgi:hypothetical protein